MKDPDPYSSRKIQADLLKRQYPQVEELLYSDELLISVTNRKPLFISGLFCVIIGILFSVQASFYLLATHHYWGIPIVLFSIVIIWVGFRLVFFIRKEIVFVTNQRIAHIKVDFSGRGFQVPFSIPLSEIAKVHLYRDTILFRSFKSQYGDIIVKRKNGSSYLVPTLMDSVLVFEIITAELLLIRKA